LPPEHASQAVLAQHHDMVYATEKPFTRGVLPRARGRPCAPP